MTHLDYDARFELKCTYNVWHVSAWLVFADMFIFIGFYGELFVPSSAVPECLVTLRKSPDSTQLAVEINRTEEASHWQPEATGHVAVCVAAFATPRSPSPDEARPSFSENLQMIGKGHTPTPQLQTAGMWSKTVWAWDPYSLLGWGSLLSPVVARQDSETVLKLVLL